ncbi:PREDICTED: subtilisin-like protease SBT1.8 [Prunus mume]|uniref:Subtilisin-like protease SBT1.8 n=1 Tax=Prunus mume TaxID=102107 RepID=A0ABM1LI70_PRUMU|nr:PREDICTED: subtilisin-like protease SBT1.8 [Prunus mume]
MNSPRHQIGHGITVASIAGNYIDKVSYFGYANGTSRRRARARIAVYKVDWEEGCNELDFLSGIENAIADGVDVIINISLGMEESTMLTNVILMGTFAAMEKGKLKQPSATQAEIRQIERVRLRVPAVERVYPKFLFTANLIKAQLVNPAESTVKPDVMAPGSQILGARVPNKPAGYVQWLEFPSLASPHVTGLAALLKSAHPKWSPPAIRSTILTANPFDNRQTPIQDAGNNFPFASPLAMGSGMILARTFGAYQIQHVESRSKKN